jgi:hypothetical protein
MTIQVGDTRTLPTAFFYHAGVLDKIQLPILTTTIATLPLATPRVPMFQYPIPEHTLEEGKSKVAVKLYTSTSLATAMVRSLPGSLPHEQGHLTPGDSHKTIHNTMSSVLDLTGNLQAVLGDAMDMATAMLPHIPTSPLNTGSVLSRHL